MISDRPSILTLEYDSEIIAEVTVFGWADAVRTADKLREDYGYNYDPKCQAFLHVDSEMNFNNEVHGS